MIQAFGSGAQRFVKRFDGVELLATQSDDPAPALQAAALRRISGQPFFVAPLLDEPRALVAQTLSGPLLTQNTGLEERRRLADILAGEQLIVNGRPQAEICVYDAATRVTVRDLLITAPAVWARSTLELDRIQRGIDVRRAFSVTAPGYDLDVPDFDPIARERIVVWAPHLCAERLGIIAIAVESFPFDVSYICAGGSIPNVRGSFHGLADAPALLARAACVVDASIGDPAGAITLAARGLRVVSATTAGGLEFLDGALEYDPWNWRHVYEAVALAIEAPVPLLKRDPFARPEIEATLARAGAAPISNAPLVSVVVTTYNRPDGLAAALGALARQTYPNLEAIVVNDAGMDVSAVTARFPFARLITLERNLGYYGALSAGLHAVRGEYFCLFCDDDLIAADHVARLVSAVTASGCRVSHADAMTRYIVSDADGEVRDIGFKANTVGPLDQLEVYGGPMIGCGTMLMHREFIPIVAYVDPVTLWSDIELEIRLCAQTDFAHTPHPTYLWHYDTSAASHTVSEGQAACLARIREVHRRYPHESVIVGLIRKQVLDDIERRYPNLDMPAFVLA